MAISFNEMKNQICHDEEILNKDETLIADYEKNLDCKFYAYWYLMRTLGWLLSSSCCYKLQK